MHLISISTAIPPHRYTQAELWEIYRQSAANRFLKPASNELIRRVLTGDSGITTRHFALQPVDKIFSLDAATLNRAYERHAPDLAMRALRQALEQAGWHPRELDALFVCTCTGYLCPGSSSYVAEKLGARKDVFLLDVVGQGCGAALPTLRAASGFARSHPSARMAVIAVEICSAAFYLDDDAGVIISACIFGDGAAATLWQGEPSVDALASGIHFDTLHWPHERESLRFENREGKLRNILKASVPEKAAVAVGQLFARHTREYGKPSRIIPHGGGRDVLLALEATLPGYCFAEAKEVLQAYGNLSSPSVLFALEAGLRRARKKAGAPEETWWLTSFGAGFSAHGMGLKLL